MRPKLACDGPTPWRPHCLPLLAIGLVIGCEAAAPVDRHTIETTHLRITSTEAPPICLGTGPLLEGELRRIATALGSPLPGAEDKLEVRLGRDAVLETCAGIFDDPETAGGCALADDRTTVAAQTVAMTTPHELVHAVRLRSGHWGPLLFEEGLADILSGSDGFPQYVAYPHGDAFTGPSELLGLPRSQFEPYYYPAAGSFVSWLWETQGRDVVLSLMDDPRLGDSALALDVIEEHLGSSLDTLEQAWREDPRPDAIWGAPCIDGRSYSLADGPVELVGDLDCDSSDVYGATGMALWPMCLDVPATTRVRISMDADHGRIQVLQREDCEAEATTPEGRRDKYVDAGDVLEEEIAGPCRYRLLVGSAEVVPTAYVVRVEEL